MKDAYAVESATTAISSIPKVYRRWLSYYFDIMTDRQPSKSGHLFGVPNCFMISISTIKRHDPRVGLNIPNLNRFCRVTGVPRDLFLCAVDSNGRLISRNGIILFIDFCIEYDFKSLLSRNDILSDIVHPDFYTELHNCLKARGLSFNFTPVAFPETTARVNLFPDAPKAWLGFYRIHALEDSVQDRTYLSYERGTKVPYAYSAIRVKAFCKLLNIPCKLFLWNTSEEGLFLHNEAYVDLRKLFKRNTGKSNISLIHANYNKLFKMK